MSFDFPKMFENHLKFYFEEDEIGKNIGYLSSLPSEEVTCHLKIKDDLILAGLPVFFAAFEFISDRKFKYEHLLEFEGQSFNKLDNRELTFKLPFNVALSGERIALNLLQKMSSIATYTNKFVAKSKHVKILDTRKTTPGLRTFEKYAVTKGGGVNHRFSQLDCFMIKDNHKTFFGGVKGAVDYYKSLNSFYMPLIMEVHDLTEIKQGIENNVRHFLLDNFSPEEIKEAVKIKSPHITYEVSGGISLDNIDGYILDGVDAISSGSIIYNAPNVDLSMKVSR